MDDLVARIKASIENRHSDPWFPELTAHLAARAWASLHRDIGLTSHSYGTQRVLSHSISAPRQAIGALKASPVLAGTPPISLEVLSEECASEYQKKGVSFYSSDEILNTTVLWCVEDALDRINQVPSLMATVTSVVQSLHVIKPRNTDHDISFSEPDVPFSIFVSVPEKRIANDALRVAEGIVHEAMHLQLTLIEGTVGLVVPSSKEFFSPWKGEYRTIQGVLHGLYVFRVIDQFLRAIISLQEVPPGELSYIRSRRGEIALQFMAIRGFEECSDLTPLGGTLVKSLIRDMSAHVRRRSLIEPSNQHSQQQNGYA